MKIKLYQVGFVFDPKPELKKLHMDSLLDKTMLKPSKRPPHLVESIFLPSERNYTVVKENFTKTFSESTANLTPIIKLSKTSSSTLNDFCLKSKSDEKIEYLLICHTKERDKETSFLYMLTSQDSTSKQLLITLMKSTSSKFIKFSLLDESIKQLLYLQYDPESKKVSLMLFVLDTLQYKRLLAIPYDKDEPFRLSKSSQSLRSYALQLQKNQIAIILDTISLKWHDSIQKSILKIKLDEDWDTLETSLYDKIKVSKDLEDKTSKNVEAMLACINKDMQLLVSIIGEATETEITTPKWKELNRFFTKANWWKQEGLIDDFGCLKFAGLKIANGVIIVVFTYTDAESFIVVNQFKVPSCGSLESSDSSSEKNMLELERRSIIRIM